jgi:hypothetical protein
MPAIVLVVKGLWKRQSERFCDRTRSFWVNGDGWRRNDAWKANQPVVLGGSLFFIEFAAG